jgi:hypothetical protein
MHQFIHVLATNFIQKLAPDQGYANFPKKYKSQLKILGTRQVTWSKFHIVDSQVSGTTSQNLVSWCLAFAHPCSRLFQVTSYIIKFVAKCTCLFNYLDIE